MSLQYLHKLCSYKQWANAKMYEALVVLPEEIIITERKIVFGSILATLHHTYLMDTVWKSHIEGIQHNITTRNPKKSPPLGDLFKDQAEIDAWFISYAESLNEDLLDEVVSFEFIGGGRGSMTRQDIVLHIVNHTTYHRGHIAGMLYESGATPPTTDMPVFLRDCG